MYVNVISAVKLGIGTKMSTPEKIGDKTQGVLSASKSKEACPPVYPWIYFTPMGAAHRAEKLKKHIYSPVVAQ